MKGLMICALATAWVLETVWLRGIRRHPYERPGHIDRDFRKMVRWVHPGRSKESTAVGELPMYTAPDGRTYVLKPHSDWTLKDSAGGSDGKSAD